MDIYQFLKDNGINYQRYDHRAVFTVEEAKEHIPALDAVETKNLFLRDSKGKSHFLVVVPYDKSVDLKALTEVLGTSRLGFASAERLNRFLGVEPGSVSVLCVVNDAKCEVQVVIDEKVWAAERVACHPLVNTSTVVFCHHDLACILEATGHQHRVLDVPSQLANKASP